MMFLSRCILIHAAAPPLSKKLSYEVGTYAFRKLHGKPSPRRVTRISQMKELRDILCEFARARHTMALATIVGTTGSSYRKPGARMLVLSDGRTIGTLSGGCLEEEIARRALTVMTTGLPVVMPIDTRRRFGCHGAIEVFIERIEPGNAFLAYLTECVKHREAACIRVVHGAGRWSASFPLGEAPLGVESFKETLPPPVRLMVVGEGPGSDALLKFADVLGWENTLLDGPVDASLEADARTAIVIKNHHFGRDFAALRNAIGRSFGYVGLLGSHRRRRELMEALMAEGWEPDDAGISHVHGPAGLDLGADLPEEIALSIVAEIQAVMARHEGGFLRDRRGRVHEILCNVAAS